MGISDNPTGTWISSPMRAGSICEEDDGRRIIPGSAFALGSGNAVDDDARARRNADPRSFLLAGVMFGNRWLFGCYLYGDMNCANA